MSATNIKIIELNKAKILSLTVGSSGFVAIGAWLLFMDATGVAFQPLFNSLALTRAIGLISVVFFGMLAIYGVGKLRDKRPGLVLSPEGILDNSNGVSAALIPWAEVTGFGILEMNKQKMLVVKLTDPEKYIESGGRIKRSLNRVNYKMCGSPVAIATGSLKIGFDELLDVCKQYVGTYGTRA